MAADSDPESEVFEITDFTTASEWERFVSKVEEVLNDWKLIGNSAGSLTPEKGEFTSGTWGEKSQDIQFADFKFHIIHYFLKQEREQDKGKDQLEEDAFPLAMQDLLCMNNDFPPRAHSWMCVSTLFGETGGTHSVLSGNACSSASCALSQVPIFVQIQQKWRRVYAGECQGPGVRTDFEMVHLRKVPSQYNHLSGLLDIFKSKIGCTLSPLPPINIAIRFTYILQDWQQYAWPQQPPDFDTLLGGEVGGVEFGKLPFGACEEPISELHLATTWSHLTEGFDPFLSSHAGDLLTEFFKLCCRKESTEEILGRGLAEEEAKENSDISSALSKLTEPTAAVPISKLSVSNIVHSARKHIRRRRRIDESPLNTDILNSILLELDVSLQLINLFLQLKSAPSDSLTYRLALCACLVNYNHGGLRAVAHLWQEFVLELRYRWENNYFVYGLAGGPPDLRCCLLHQKLQMLNCCIERKRARDEARKVLEGSRERERQVSGGRPPPESATPMATVSGAAREVSSGKSWDSWSDSEEEFFECLSDQGEIEAEKDGSKSKAEGRLHPYNNMTLLNSTEPLYVPVTQEPAPMTEDLLEEQSEVLAKLGTSAEGTHLRARMQSACLLSDMESFKSANPGCALEDFVRWYSPRDYVEEEDEVIDETGSRVVKGELSARMKIPGNMWVEAWETARVTPARRQRRLFDDTKEAEKVLHYLAVQKPADLTRNLLPCILHAAILKLKEEESVEDIPSVKRTIQQATGQASKLLHPLNHDYKKIEDFISQLMAMETAITRARSLKAKFASCEGGRGEDAEELEKFVSSLQEEPEVVVIGAGQGPAGSIIHRLFVNAQRTALLAPLDEDLGRDRKPAGGSSKVPDFPSPAGREILLRTCVPRPAPYSKVLPQRLFCVLMREEFRLAGAFSLDTAFF
uniref:Rab3 GTPase-activating protein catalytic subunit n=1 Tax=Cyclopterus lumpus TaxID=8103 RepID=A0A8C3A1K4_CYCLU